MLPISLKIFQFIGMLRLETSWSPLLCLLRLLCRFLRFLCHLTGVTLLNPLEHTTGVKRGWSAAVFPVSSLCRLHRKHFFQAPTADLQVQKSEVWDNPLYMQSKWVHSNPKSRHFWLFMTGMIFQSIAQEPKEAFGITVPGVHLPLVTRQAAWSLATISFRRFSTKGARNFW